MLNNKNLQKNLGRTGVQPTRNLGPLFKIRSWTKAALSVSRMSDSFLNVGQNYAHLWHLVTLFRYRHLHMCLLILESKGCHSVVICYDFADKYC